MAETSSGSKGFGKTIQKKFARAREKVLQNLGKRDNTLDEDYELHVENFKKQQIVSCRLQKELKNYIMQVKALSLASKTFYDTLSETYEEEWTGHSDVKGSTEPLNQLWEDYVNMLTQHLQEPLLAYIASFPDMKHKISKRDRKLTDYDRARHDLLAEESNKKRNELKIQKAREEMMHARAIYNEINNELHQELPIMYESRKSFFSSHFNTLYTGETKFQEESSKIKQTLAEVTANMQKECTNTYFAGHKSTARVSGHTQSEDHSSGLSKFYQVPNIPSTSSHDTGSNSDNHSNRESVADSDDLSPPVNNTAQINGEVRMNNNQPIVQKLSSSSYEPVSPVTPNEHMYEPISLGQKEVAVDVKPIPSTVDPTPEPDELELKALDSDVANSVLEDSGKNEEVEKSYSLKIDAPIDPDPEPVETESADDDAIARTDTAEKEKSESVYVVASPPEEDIYKVPSSNKPVDKNQILFKVLATHAYQGEDIDELTFESGEIIDVVAFDDPDEQDDGWLMGLKITSGDKGVFPENFTKRI